MASEESIDQSLPTVRKMNDYYHSLGLLTGVFGLNSKPGETDPMHRHGAARIFIIAGSVELRLEDKAPRTVGPGQEIVINDQQGHEVTIGPEGWLYLFACDTAEAKAQEIEAQVS